jgi:hypothetical protein
MAWRPSTRSTDEQKKDSSELSRAEWFWRQRPKLILGEGFLG